jgi:hypothetical protein
VITAADLIASAAFLAAATDKSGELTLDEVAYLNAFLGINLDRTGDVTWSVMDDATFTYDRSDTFENVSASVLVLQADGSDIVRDVNVYDAVLSTEDYAGGGAFEAYAQAADDARLMIKFIHAGAIPADKTN